MDDRVLSIRALYPVLRLAIMPISAGCRNEVQFGGKKWITSLSGILLLSYCPDKHELDNCQVKISSRHCCGVSIVTAVRKY
jgi:hypothetical protein